jgi:serine/threonine protein kinase
MSVKMGDDSPSEPPFPDIQAREYFRQLILGLEYLHANGVIHRDVRIFFSSLSSSLFSPRLFLLFLIILLYSLLSFCLSTYLDVEIECGIIC